MARSKSENADKNLKDNNNNALDVMQQIKEIEQKKRNMAVKVEVVVKEQQINFDVWWMERSPFIPKQHRKEIIRADFNGRGLGDNELKEAFDAALEQYGLKIK